jgi:serine/threonine protein kinase HipA of HipAB toxin-antitoxin module
MASDATPSPASSAPGLRRCGTAGLQAAVSSAVVGDCCCQRIAHITTRHFVGGSHLLEIQPATGPHAGLRH